MVKSLGFRSAESKRALTRATWAGGVVIGLLQLIVPVVLVIWAVIHAVVGAFTTPTPEVEAPTVADGHIVYTAPLREEGEGLFSVTERRQILRAPIGDDGAPEVLAEIAGDSDDPMLLSVDESIYAIDNNAVSIYADGEVQRFELAPENELPSNAWPIVYEGQPAVVVIDGHALGLRVWEQQQWRTRWTQEIEIDFYVNRLRAVQADDGLHVFVGNSEDTVFTARREDGAFGNFVDTKIPADTWTAVALDGQPVVFQLDFTVEPSGIVGWRAGNGWRRFLAEKAQGAMWIGATAVGGRAVVTTDATFDGIEARIVAGDAVVETHEYATSSIWGEFIGLLVLSQLAPLLLSGLLALFLSGRMQAHRITEIVAGTGVARYASLSRRAAAKAVDMLIAISVPIAVFVPHILGDAGPIDESWAYGVALLWGVPLGLAFTALEGAYGWTPGKRLFGIRVVDLSLHPPGFGAAFMRGLLGCIDGFFSGVVGIVAIATSPQWQRIGDQAAHTIVVEHPIRR